MKLNFRRRGVTLAVLVLAGVAAGAVAIVKDRHHRQSVARGQALFRGEGGLVGRITGQSAPLPAMATRCSNCHAGSTDGAAVGAKPAYAVPLDRAAMTELRSRRGGPVSRFDKASLCVLVRSGIDPTQIIIPQAMPRYEITDQDCSALWDYLQTS